MKPSQSSLLKRKDYANYYRILVEQEKVRGINFYIDLDQVILQWL